MSPASNGRQRERDLQHALRTVPLDGPSDWPTLVAQLGQVLGGERAGIYGFDFDGAKATARLVHFVGPFHGTAQAYVDALVGGALTFDPLHVPMVDRNAVSTLDELIRKRRVPANARESLTAFGKRFFAVPFRQQLRAVLAEGATMLAWVGGASEDPHAFSGPARNALRRLIPAFHRRLSMERRLSSLPLRSASLEAALERLVEPAYVVDGTMRPVLMNTPGRVAYDASPGTVRAELSSNDETLAFRVTRLAGRGLTRHQLLVRHASGGDAINRLTFASSEWKLSGRETQVLALVADGWPNANIARSLSVAERTIELHMTALMKKARVGNRAALVAKFWSGRAE